MNITLQRYLATRKQIIENFAGFIPTVHQLIQLGFAHASPEFTCLGIFSSNLMVNDGFIFQKGAKYYYH